jgi:C-terminal peptidase prc
MTLRVRLAVFGVIALFLIPAQASDLYSAQNLPANHTNPAIDVAQTSPDEPLDEDEDVEEKQYWKEVDFTEVDFAEVLRLIKIYYIDSNYDRRLAWIFAANGVLGELETPWQVLPQNFWNRKKGTDEFKKRYTGKQIQLRPGDPFVLVETNKDFKVERSKKALTPKDVRDKKKEIQQRQRELDSALGKLPFTEADYGRVLDWALKQIKGTEISKKDLILAAAQGYLASLDPHSGLITAKAWDEATKSTEDASFQGIGALLTQHGDDTIVENPIEDQPAVKAGVRAGDTIIAIDGRSIAGIPLHKVVKRIRGPKGTSVTLTIRRLGEPNDLEITIVRGFIEIKNVQSRLLKDHPDLGYIKVTGFIESTRQSIKGTIESLTAATKGGRLRGLILDLRNNSGGLLKAAVDIADDFLNKGIIVTVKNPSSRDEVYKATKGSFDFPVVVLVDSTSASASEILASAIQENQRGLVIGDRTFGKASVQTLLNPLFRRDYYIKLTVARYYAPSDRTIQVTGVIPDVTVPASLTEEPFPPFREEDLSHHLVALSADYPPHNAELVARLSPCVRTRGIADDLAKKQSKGQIKLDYQLWKAADYLECMYSDRQSRAEVR